MICPSAMARDGAVIRPEGVGDVAPAPIIVPTVGAAVRPLSPVHLRAVRLINDDSEIRWVRRSREGWRWRDGVDAAIGEESERYRVTFDVSGLVRVTECSQRYLVYSAADQAGDAQHGATVKISVQQLGTRAASMPASIILTIA